MNAQQPTALERTAAALAKARRVAVLTGAGVSAESGIPTFRGVDGLWRNYSPAELASPQAFASDPQLVWEWYDWRRSVVSQCQPNAAHRFIALLEHRPNAPDFTLITQNVDGLHQAAGSQRVLELHGNIWTLRCTSCDRVRVDRSVPLPLLPHCSACGALERPHIVWFGENLDETVFGGAVSAASQADVLLVVGTSAVVFPAAGLAPLCKRAGGFVAVYNLEERHTRTMDAALIGKASSADSAGPTHGPLGSHPPARGNRAERPCPPWI
jgi:NAD-dependent deacetylase